MTLSILDPSRQIFSSAGKSHTAEVKQADFKDHIGR